MAKGKVITGARARLSINGKKVGFATNCSGNETIELQDVEVLDNIEVEELVPVSYRVEFQASQVWVEGETIKSEGYFPRTGNSPEEHLQNILAMPDMVVTLEDSKSGALLMTLEQVKVSGKSFTLNARGIAGNDVTFRAIRMKDQSEV